MKRPQTIDLLDKEPVAFDLFSLISFRIFAEVENKELTDELIDYVTDLITDELFKDCVLDGVAVINRLALIVFSLDIWEELDKLDKPEQEKHTYEKFKKELKPKRA